MDVKFVAASTLMYAMKENEMRKTAVMNKETSNIEFLLMNFS